MMQRALRSGYRPLIVATALLLALTPLWSAGSQEGGGATAESAGPYGKTIEISWIGPGGAAIQDGNYVQKRIEETFNVKLVNRKVDVHETEQINLMLSTGEMPDCGFLYSNPVDLYDKGLTRTISKAFITEYAPLYTRLLDRFPFGWKVNAVSGAKDEYLSLTGIAMNQRAHIMHSVYRLDWLENVDLLPTDKSISKLTDDGSIQRTTVPFTLAELEEILQAYTYGDPDGNGKDDTFGMSACSDTMYSWNTIMGAHGYAYRYNLNIGGKVVEWCVSPQHKAFLKTVHDWYTKGWIDPEFVTLNRTKMWEKIASGIIGYHNNPFNYVNPESEGLKNRPPMAILARNPEASILIAVGEVGPEGHRGVGQWTAGGIFNYNFFINRNVDDEKLARILQIFDYINLDKEGRVWAQWGEEGVHFDWSGEPYASPPILRSGVGQETGLGFYKHSITDESYMAYMYPEVPRKLYEWASTEGAEYVYRPYKWDFFNETGYADVNAKYGSGLQTIWQEFFFKAITGEVNIDAEWDAYVAKWLKAGGDKLTAEIEKAMVVE